MPEVIKNLVRALVVLKILPWWENQINNKLSIFYDIRVHLFVKSFQLLHIPLAGDFGSENFRESNNPEINVSRGRLCLVYYTVPTGIAYSTCTVKRS